MNQWTILVLAALVISIVMTGILIPKILLIAFRKNLFDVPDERKIHKGVVPRLGGIAFMLAVFFSIALLAGSDTLLFDGMVCNAVMESNTQICFGMCALLILYLVGIADDLIGVKYRAKFVVQILSALFLVFAGVWISDLCGFCGIYFMPWPVGWIVTVFAVVFIVNAINLIDGIDGLASGLSAVALTFYGVIFLILHQYVYSLISFATLGTLIPFFYYNVFGNPVLGKKIFMGDTGSLTVGIILSFLSIEMSRDPQVAELTFNPFVLAFSPLIVPCFDVLRVYMHRIRMHHSPFLPDKSHIHHKFLAMGMNQRLALITILIISVLITAVNVILSSYVNVTILLIVDVAVWTFGNIWLTSCIRRHEDALHLTSNRYTQCTEQ